MKVTVKYLTRERPNIDIQLRLIADGVWLLYCDFMERFECSGQLYDHPVNSILFEKDDKAIFSINIPYREDLIIFGRSGKKNYHALIMNYKKYCEIMEREDVNES